MHKTRLALLVGALLASGVSLAEDAKAPAPAIPGNVNIAVVNGTPYSLDLFRVFYVERLQETKGQNDPAFQQQAFNEFMTMIVAAQEADKRKLGDRPDVTAAIALQRLKVMSNAALASMAQDVKVTDDELKKTYEDLKKNASRTEYKARHILVKDEATARKLIKQLEKGADFADLARKNSEGPTAKNGGELDWFDSSQTVKPIADAVATLKPGTYTKDPVQSQFGWHIIKLEESRTAQPPSFEDAKPQLTAMVQREKLGQQIVKMRDAAKVELNEDVVKVTPKTPADAPAADSKPK
jgi:peptidyl-prolyl cis-trans isomerase C